MKVNEMKRYYYLVSIVVRCLIGTIRCSKPKKLILNLVHQQTLTTSIQLDDQTEDPLLNLYLIKEESVMMVQFRIGEPSLEQYAVMDTGSRNRWVMCKSKYKFLRTNSKIDKAVTLYDPLKSSTYKSVPCGDPICPTKYYCPQPTAPCRFDNHYGSAKVVGLLGVENFNFTTYDDGTVSVQSLFGCVDLSTQGQISTDERFSGVFGLADITFLSNLGKGNPRFSYCIGDLTKSKDSYSHLQMGEDVELDGTISRLWVAEHSHLTVIVKSMSMGDQNLNFGPLIFIIDSGSFYTRFVPKWHYRIKRNIQDVMLGLGYEYNNGIPRHINGDCFFGSVIGIKGFPGLQLRFADQQGETPMILNPSRLFYQLSKTTFCFAIKVSNVSDNVLGLWAQQGYNFGFDLGNKKFYFYTIDCSDLI